MNRWFKPGVLDRVLETLQQAQIVRIKLDRWRWAAPLWRCIPTTPGAKENGGQSIGKARGGWTTRIHHPGGATQVESRHRLALQQGQLQAAQRERVIVPSPEGVSTHRLPLREARRDVLRVHRFRLDRRCASIALTGSSRA
jgi:hypothetical protein